jgi:hypothetical protein
VATAANLFGLMPRNFPALVASGRNFESPSFHAFLILTDCRIQIIGRIVVTRVAIGALIGLAAALVAARIVASALYHVSPADPISMAAAVRAVAAIGLLAVYAPVRRALRVDPMTTLRKE